MYAAQIQQTQDTMRISVQLHKERKYYVLVNRENIVIPQQLVNSKVTFIYIYYNGPKKCKWWDQLIRTLDLISPSCNMQSIFL